MVFIIVSGILTICLAWYLGFMLIMGKLIDKKSLPYKWGYEINFIITLLVILGIATAWISAILFYYS